MSNGGLALTAIEPTPRSDWLEQTKSLLIELDLNVVRRRNGLLVWRDKLRRGNIHYSDAIYLQRNWLSPRRSAIGITSRRVYFSGNGTEIDDRPERIVLSETRRPDAPLATDQLRFQWELINALKDKFSHRADSVSLSPHHFDIGSAREVHISGGVYLSPPERLNNLYRDHGFDENPRNFTISLCPLESVPIQIIDEFARRLEHLARQRQLDLVVRKNSPEAILRRLNEIAGSGVAASEGHCVLFVLPDKKQTPEAVTFKLFREMEKADVPFRRAYSSDPLDFSIPDQFPSLVCAAGGVPHRSPTGSEGGPIWTIGVDLSHRVGRGASVLALTLVNPNGTLMGAWKQEQPLDETARVETIRVLLTHCSELLSDHESDARVAILRDGRMFENEDSGLYRDILKTDISLFEYRKRGNPQIVHMGKDYVLPKVPIAAMLPGTSTMFITTASPRDERTLANVAKVTWLHEWNGLDLDPEEIARFLASSSVAPGLGLHARHLPAAIYWADGIAGASDEDLRFRGTQSSWI
jgi:hypothetical protein